MNVQPQPTISHFYGTFRQNQFSKVSCDPEGKIVAIKHNHGAFDNVNTNMHANPKMGEKLTKCMREVQAEIERRLPPSSARDTLVKNALAGDGIKLKAVQEYQERQSRKTQPAVLNPNPPLPTLPPIRSLLLAIAPVPQVLPTMSSQMPRQLPPLQPKRKREEKEKEKEVELPSNQKRARIDEEDLQEKGVQELPGPVWLKIGENCAKIIEKQNIYIHDGASKEKEEVVTIERGRVVVKHCHKQEGASREELVQCLAAQNASFRRFQQMDVPEVHYNYVKYEIEKVDSTALWILDAQTKQNRIIEEQPFRAIRQQEVEIPHRAFHASKLAKPVEDFQELDVPVYFHMIVQGGQEIGTIKKIKAVYEPGAKAEGSLFTIRGNELTITHYHSDMNATYEELEKCKALQEKSILGLATLGGSNAGYLRNQIHKRDEVLLAEQKSKFN